jgi:hypothetical protein
VLITKVENLIATIHLPRRNALNVEKWATSPLIAKTNMKKVLSRARSLKARKSYLRSITRKKMTWLAMLNEIRMLVRIPILILTMLMMNPPRRVLPKLSLRRLSSLFDTPYCLTAKGEPKVCDDDAFLYDDLVERISNPDDVLRNIIRKYKDLKKKHASLQDFY